MDKPRVILCGLDRTPICSLSDRSGYCAMHIKEELAINEITTLSFQYPIVNGGKWTNLKNEQLVLFNNEYYRIKNLSINHDEDGNLYVEVSCKHYSDNLANTMISIDEQTPLNVIDLMKIALCYDENNVSEFGWSIGNIEVDRVAMRGLEAVEQSPFSILLTIADKYDGILKFNSQTMTIDMLKAQDTNHPTFDLRVSKNLKNFNIEYDTSEMVTRLYCYGATDDNGNALDITSVEPHNKPYIENFDYFKTIGYSEEYINAHKDLFLSTNIWTDDVFVDAQDLYNEGLKQSEKLSQPTINISVSALDMNTANNDITKFDLGACIRVYDEDLGADVLCNVIKRTKDYDNPHILNCEVTSAITYHNTLSQLFTNVNTTSKIVTSGGNLVGGQGTTMGQVQDYLNLYYLNAEQIEADYATINELRTNYFTAEEIRATYIDADSIGAKYATIASLNAIEAKIKDLDVDTINAKFANIDELFSDNATFHKLVATDAEINELKADNITVAGKLKADKAELENLIATKVTAGDFEAYKATIENMFALYATIEELEANYLKVNQAEVTYAKITELEALTGNFNTLNADLAKIEELVAKKASIEDLNAANANIKTLQADLANVNTLVANKVDADYVKAQITESTKTITDDLTAIHAIVDVLDTKYATIEQLNVAKANLETLIANKATIEDLNAANANIGNLQGLVANINTILSGSVGTGTLQTIHLTASNVVIDDAIIKSANIENIDVSKLNAGTISTDKFVIQSDNGGILISGSTQQFKDKNGKVRLQVGQDAQGNFNFIVFGEDGTTAIYNENGITQNAVPDGLIVDKMVADDAAIQAKKVQFIDKDGSKTLQTYLTTEQGKIESLIKETTIDNGDGTTTSLKDAYNQTKQTVEGNKTTIANVQTTVNYLTDDVESMDSRITNVEATAEGIKTTVSKIKVGTRNLIYNTDFSIDQTSNWKTFNANATISSDNSYMKVVQAAVNSGCYAKYAKGFKKDKDYVVSFVAYASEQCSLTYNYIMSSNTSTVGNQPLGSGVSISTEPTLYVIKFTANNDFPENSSIMLGANKAVTWYFKEMMCEEGTINSSWTVAPEDDIAYMSGIEQKANKIGLIVKSGDSESNLVLTDKTIELVSDGINLKGLVTFSGLDSSAQSKIDNAQSSADKANEKIDNLEVGGRNYALNTSFNWSEWFVPVADVADSYNVFSFANMPDTLEIGDTYTLSIELEWSKFTTSSVKAMTSTLQLIPYVYENGNSVVLSGELNNGVFELDEDLEYSNGVITVEDNDVVGSWVYTANYIDLYDLTDMMLKGNNTIRIEKQITFETKEQIDIARYGIAIRCNYSDGTGKVKVRKIKLEKGEKATDWTPAPEDKVDYTLINDWSSNTVKPDVTTINGGYIQTNTIDTSRLNTQEIYANSAFIGAVQAVNINADMINAGTIKAKFLDLYGFKMLNRQTNQESLSITDQGDITMRGSIESYNYHSGKTGWAINSTTDDAEFNNVTVRGSVITNDGGIVSAGGSGRNLQLNTSFYNGLTSWSRGDKYSVDTGFQYKLTNTVKFERSDLTADSIQYLYSGWNKIPCTVGKSYTAQANFYTKDSSAIDGSGVIFGIYFYTSDNNRIGTFSKKVSFTNNQWVYESITAVAPQNAVYVAIVIGAYRNGTFWMAHPKLEEGDIATEWSLAPEDKMKQVRFWAGTNYDERESAPFIVYNDGSIKATQGEFGGVFSGTVEIGNITILDPSKTSGNDALLTIQNGQNGVKRVQLTDTNSSSFAQSLIVTDNSYNTMIELGQNGYGLFSGGINIGNNIKLEGSHLAINGYELTTNSSGFLFNATQIDVGTVNNTSTLNVYGSVYIKESARIANSLKFGDMVKATINTSGVDFDFIG